ncbi:hypothetical protein T03_3585 [Trichinella britovi]|uniref:Uncharacterized protein n=1 Tax=Trichinella britovi TaxID=45882 RepID=A0A0V1CQH4_TRIBR|nr:hypothetical protein T03_3585 [Trichinella britovi]
MGTEVGPTGDLIHFEYDESDLPDQPNCLPSVLAVVHPCVWCWRQSTRYCQLIMMWGSQLTIRAVASI